MSDRRQLVAQITADPKGLDAGLANASRRGKRGGQRLGRELAVSVKRGFGSIGDLIGLGGVAGVLAAGKQVFDFQKKLVRLRQASREGAGTMQQLEKQLFAVARARGLDPDELLGGAAKYTELTGDLKGYIAQLDSLAEVATTGAGTMDELAAIAAAASGQMNVASDDMGKMFDVLVSQGQRGSVELRELASELPSLIAMHRNFGKTGADAMAELGAMLQMGKKGFGTGSEAATGYQRLAGAIIKNAKTLAKYKVQVYDKKGNKRAVSDILNDLAKVKKLEGKKGDAKMLKLLGSKEAFLFFSAYKAEGEKVFQDLADQQKALGTVKEAAKIWDDSPAKKMASAQARMAEFFNENMKNHIEKIAIALDKVAIALQFVVENWQLLAAAMAGGKGLALLGDLAGAGGGGGGRGGGRGGKGGGGGDLFGKLQAASLSLGAGLAVGDYVNQKTGASGFISRNVLGNKGVVGALSTFNPLVGAAAIGGHFAGEAFDMNGNRAAEAGIEGRTRATRNRRTVRQDVMSQAFAAAGASPEMFSPEQLQSLQAPLSDKLRAGGGLGSLTGMIGQAELPALIAEIRRLRETMQREGGTSVTVNADGANSTTHRRRGM